MNNRHVGRAGVVIRKSAWKQFLKSATVLCGLYAAAWAFAYMAYILFSYDDIMAKGGAILLAVLAVVAFGSTWILIRNRALIHEPVSRVSAAIAEENVGDILKLLPEGYMAFHDILLRYGEKQGQSEHVVVGPAGIFVIETKGNKGKVSLSDDDQLLLNGRPFERKLTEQVLAQIDSLRTRLSGGGELPFINGIVVFTNAMVLIRKPVQNLYFMNKGYLLEHIAKQDQNVLSAAEVEHWQRAFMQIKKRSR